MSRHPLSYAMQPIELSADEHLALSARVQELCEVHEPDEIEEVLGVPAAWAYEMAFSLLLLEERARLRGVEWLGEPVLGGAIPFGRPVVNVWFGDRGATWMVDEGQRAFTEACRRDMMRQVQTPAHMPVVYEV